MSNSDDNVIRRYIGAWDPKLVRLARLLSNYKQNLNNPTSDQFNEALSAVCSVFPDEFFGALLNALVQHMTRIAATRYPDLSGVQMEQVKAFVLAHGAQESIHLLTALDRCWADADEFVNALRVKAANAQGVE